MLSAIAKYIFGGILHETPEEPEPFETEEVNDWLLVNMPYQAFDSIEDLENEDDDDDVLTAVPQLMMQDDTCDKSFLDINTASYCDLPELTSLDNSLALKSSYLNEHLEDFQILPESMYLNQSLYYPADYSIVVSQYIANLDCNTPINSDKPVLVIQDRVPLNKPKAVVVRVSNPKNVNKTKPNKPVNNHPATRDYCNHRPPVLPAKADLLERIKDLKPIQQAIEYDMKKHLSRSHLHRHNKNYIYESSAKINRRKDLWRQHSGANNNRKC